MDKVPVRCGAVIVPPVVWRSGGCFEAGLASLLWLHFVGPLAGPAKPPVVESGISADSRCGKLLWVREWVLETWLMVVGTHVKVDESPPVNGLVLRQLFEQSSF